MKTKYPRLRQTTTRELANVPSPPHHIRHTDITCTPDNLGNLVTGTIIFLSGFSHYGLDCNPVWGVV